MLMARKPYEPKPTGALLGPLLGMRPPERRNIGEMSDAELIGLAIAPGFAPFKYTRGLKLGQEARIAAEGVRQVGKGVVPVVKKMAVGEAGMARVPKEVSAKATKVPPAEAIVEAPGAGLVEAPRVPQADVVAKEPWMMTQQEFIHWNEPRARRSPGGQRESNARARHRIVVENALKEGKPVPQDVLDSLTAMERRVTGQVSVLAPVAPAKPAAVAATEAAAAPRVPRAEVAAPAPKVPAKQPWEMTRDEYLTLILRTRPKDLPKTGDWGKFYQDLTPLQGTGMGGAGNALAGYAQHHTLIERALSQGKPRPPPTPND